MNLIRFLFNAAECKLAEERKLEALPPIKELFVTLDDVINWITVPRLIIYTVGDRRDSSLKLFYCSV